MTEEELEKELTELKNEKARYEKYKETTDKQLREINEQILDIYREAEDIEREKGFKQKRDFKGRIGGTLSKGFFDIDQICFLGGTIRTAITAKSNIWVEKENRQRCALEMEVFKGISNKAELKKTIKKMIADLEWLLENIPKEWG